MEKLDCFDLYEDAEFYDLEFAKRNFDIDFFVQESKAAKGAVLELACGTGRITFPVASAGVEIVGLDVSKEMIERAKHKYESAKIEFLCADGRDYELNRKFELIFAATNALQHLHSPESVIAFLKTAKRHLMPDGTLIVDVFNPALDKLIRPKSEIHPHKEFNDTDGAAIKVEVASQYFQATQILHFDLFYSRTGEGIFRTKSVNMRCFFPQEMDFLCRTAGFSIERKLGGYDGGVFVDTSPKQILYLKAAR